MRARCAPLLRGLSLATLVALSAWGLSRLRTRPGGGGPEVPPPPPPSAEAEFAAVTRASALRAWLLEAPAARDAVGLSRPALESAQVKLWEQARAQVEEIWRRRQFGEQLGALLEHGLDPEAASALTDVLLVARILTYLPGTSLPPMVPLVGVDPVLLLRVQERSLRLSEMPALDGYRDYDWRISGPRQEQALVQAGHQVRALRTLDLLQVPRELWGESEIPRIDTRLTCVNFDGIPFEPPMKHLSPLMMAMKPPSRERGTVPPLTALAPTLLEWRVEPPPGQDLRLALGTSDWPPYRQLLLELRGAQVTLRATASPPYRDLEYRPGTDRQTGLLLTVPATMVPVGTDRIRLLAVGVQGIGDPSERVSVREVYLLE